VEKLFDLSLEYDGMLNEGLKYSGEDKIYFLKNRIKGLKRVLPKDKEIKKILDFGCGIGDSSQYLKESFPNAQVFGVDTAVDAIAYAKNKFPGIIFQTNKDFTEKEFDLCYCNGVFHHILPDDRSKALEFIHSRLNDGGFFSMFENNPLNLGTRYVMSKIPFDRDAITIYHYNASKLLKRNGFSLYKQRFLFIFPALLNFLRFTEPWFERIPIGAQYLMLVQKRMK
jgi:SAM-dependent methyltransferase